MRKMPLNAIAWRAESMKKESVSSLFLFVRQTIAISLFSCHQVQNDLVGFMHTLSSQLTNILNGTLHTIADDECTNYSSQNTQCEYDKPGDNQRNENIRRNIRECAEAHDQNHKHHQAKSIGFLEEFYFDKTNMRADNTENQADHHVVDGAACDDRCAANCQSAIDQQRVNGCNHEANRANRIKTDDKRFSLAEHVAYFNYTAYIDHDQTIQGGYGCKTSYGHDFMRRTHPEQCNQNDRRCEE